MRSIFLKIIFVFCCFSIFSQQRKIDSLLNCVQNSKNDTIRVDELNQLSRFYIYYMPQKASFYARKAIHISNNINYKNGLAYSYMNLGYYSFRIDDYQSSKMWYNKANNIFILVNNRIGQGLCYQLIAKTLNGLGDYEISMDYLIKSHKCFDDADFPKGIGKVYEIMGGINDIFGDYELALDNLNKSIKMKSEYNDLEDMSRPYAYLGNVYLHLNQKDKSIENFNLALDISRKNYNLNTESYALTRLGDLYFKHEDFDRSIDHYMQSLEITTLHSNLWGRVRNLQGIGKGFFRKGNQKESLVYLKRSIEIAKGINDKVGLKNSYEYIYKIYDQYDSIDNAYHFYKLYNAFKDSLFNKNVVSNISLTQIKYKSEQEQIVLNKEQEKKDIINQKEKEKTDIIIYYGIALLILMISSMILLFKQLINAKKKKLIVEKQKNLVEEKNQEITDSISYAQKIQEALLTSSGYISNIFPKSFVYFNPKDLVSGDFYWLYSSEEYVFFTVFDCTGHGVPGAFMSMIGNSLLNEMIIEREIVETNKIMDIISNKIKISLGQKGEDGESRDGMDMVLCRLNKKTNELMFTCAKNPLWIIRDDELIEFKGDDRPVGYYIGKGISFTSQTFQLKNNDVIYIFSDGFADQFGGLKRKKYKTINFKNLLISISKREMDSQYDLLSKEFDDWKGDHEQIDDVCIMGVRI